MPIAAKDNRRFLNGPALPLPLIALFLILASAIAALAYRNYQVQKEAVEHQVRNQLFAVADSKVAEISEWRTRQLEEARVLMADRFALPPFQRVISGAAGSADSAAVKAWLEELCRRRHFASATLADDRGNVILSVGRVFGASGHLRQLAEDVVRANQPVIRDLHVDESSGVIHMSVNLPLRLSSDLPPFGVILLSIDPEDQLYPMLLRWPIPSRSAEIALVRREGDELVFLNQLRFRQNAALRLRIPLASSQLPAVQAMHGARGAVEARDYRGVAVFAAVSAVPDTSWFLVAKVDAEEVQAPVRRQLILLIAVSLSLILSVSIVVLLLWRRRQLQFHHATNQADLERQALVGHYDYLNRFANDIILMVDQAGLIMEANDRAVSAYGFTREELLCRSVKDLRHPSSLAAYQEEWEQVQERGSLMFETVHQGRDGHPFPVEVSVRFIQAGGNQFRQSIIRDISERKALDERLRRMLDAFSAVIESSPAAIVSVTPDLKVTTWNKAAERIFGWTAQEAIGTTVPFLPPGDRDRAIQTHQEVMQGAVISGRRLFGQRKDGSTLHASVSAAPVHGQDGHCVGVVLNLLDTTEHAKAEEALRRNEFLYRATFDQAGVGMNYVSLDGRFLRVNPRFCQITGYSAEELLGLRFQDLTCQEDLQDSRERSEALMSGRTATSVQNKRYRRKDGSTVWVLVTASLLRNDSGEPLHFVAVVEEITERMRAEEALRRSEDRFRRLVESAPQGILVESGLRLLYVNRAALALFGATSASQLEGRGYLDLVSPEDHATARERSAQVAASIPAPTLERRYLRLDGTFFPVEVSAAPIEYDRQPASLIFLRDITDRKRTEAENRRLEEQLLQSQKMESLGRLAGGVAHDFNNHLTVINGYCDMILGRPAIDETIAEELGEIRAAGGRATSLTQQLLAFSRKQIAERKPLDLNNLVAESGKMLGRLIGEQIAIVPTLDPHLGLVVADRSQMTQILMNLTINARDAMPSGGSIAIETANVDLDQVAAARCKSALPGAFVRLSVADTGVGMDAETVLHVFEPFFTTKGMGIGTGLGLSTVYGIVRQSGGWIQVDSAPGKGSRFEIFLPRVAGVATPGNLEQSGEDAPRGTETILLAEDQPEVRRMASRILQSNGYTVMEAASGPEALALARKHEGTIDLLLTDVVMPGMTGRELAIQLLASRPHLNVLYMSGYTADVIGREGVLEPGVAYLPKPFAPAQLSIKVREVLGQSKPVGTILVVDDDEAVRGLLQQTLCKAGYEVHTAADGRAAMKLVAQHRFDVVLTDLVMPEQEGIETIRELRQDYPEVRVVAMSGAVDDVFLKTAGILGADVTLRKPLDSQVLLRIVRELLA